MSTRSNDILIVGGGLGGAATTLALGRKGREVRLLEEAPEFGVIGYGIQLGPNVFHMFERLGLSEAVLRVSIVPRALVMLDALDGHEVAVVPTGESFEARFRHPYIVLHRIDLHHVLGVRAFDLRNVLRLDPQLLTDSTHEHDSDISSVSICEAGAVDGLGVEIAGIEVGDFLLD